MVVILEITESIGLLFRKTQLIGLYSFILLHIYLSLGGFIDFAAVCISLMISFIPAKSYLKYQHILSQKIDLLFLRIDRLHCYILGLICIGIIVFIERTYNIFQEGKVLLHVFNLKRMRPTTEMKLE